MTSPGDIVCGEVGSPAHERWGGTLQLTPEDAAAIASLEMAEIVTTRAGPGGLEIGGTDHVGTVALPSGRRLHIRPKVDDLTVLDWLAYVGDCPSVAPGPPGSSFARRGSLPELVARQFLEELEALTRRGLRAGFVRQRHDDTVVRGRILPHALSRTYHRLPHVPQSRRARSLDTPAHRLLAAALDRVARFPGHDDAETSARVSHLVCEWSFIERDVLDVGSAVARCAANQPPGYAAAIRLAALILLGATPDVSAPAAAGSFLVSLASVWERALRRMCGEVARATGWSPVPDAARTKRWDDGPGLRDPHRWMTADVILTSASRRWVLDAKYKRGYGDEERDDRFQMTAYAMAFNARRATLVYPTATTPRARWRLLLSGQIGGQPTTIDSLELPMRAGPAPCRQALLDAVLALGAAAPCPELQLDHAGS